MPLYRWNPDNLEVVPATTFEAEQLRERDDLQRLLRDQPDVLEEGLFIIAEEFGNLGRFQPEHRFTGFG